MVRTLLSHSWKKFTRSVSFGKDAATLIFTGLIGLMMLVYSLALGLTLDIIITKGLEQSDPVLFLNSLLLYYFAFEFVMRYMMQNLPVLDIQPYLHLPIKKNNLVHFLLLRSVVHLLNFLPLVIFTPFSIKVIASASGGTTALSWIMAVWLVSLCLHFLVVLFKKKLDDNIWGIMTLMILFSFFAAADYYQWFKLSNVSALVFNSFVSQPALVVIPFLITAALYVFNFRFFRASMYTEEISTQRKISGNSARDISFLKNFGMIGEMINVELKLIMRNKRPKNILFLSAFFLLYGLLFYTNDMYSVEMPGMLLFVGIFITGIFMINYGQMLFSWQGSHFDFTLTRPVSIRQYVESKYWLLTGVTLVCFILSTPYLYFGWKILFIQFAMMLFNIGINAFIILNIAMWDPKKVDLKKGATFNYQGIGAAQWVMSIPILLGPYLFYMPFSLAGHENVGIAAVGLIGAVGFIFRNQLIDMTTKRLVEKKYKIAAGFRKD